MNRKNSTLSLGRQEHKRRDWYMEHVRHEAQGASEARAMRARATSGNIGHII